MGTLLAALVWAITGFANPATFDWAPPAPREGQPVLHYELAVYAQSDPDTVLSQAIVEAPTASVAVPLWLPLEVRVRAVSAAGAGAWSSSLLISFNTPKADTDGSGGIGLPDWRAVVDSIGLGRGDTGAACDTSGDGLPDGPCDLPPAAAVE